MLTPSISASHTFERSVTSASGAAPQYLPVSFMISRGIVHRPERPCLRSQSEVRENVAVYIRRFDVAGVCTQSR